MSSGGAVGPAHAFADPTVAVKVIGPDEVLETTVRRSSVFPYVSTVGKLGKVMFGSAGSVKPPRIADGVPKSPSAFGSGVTLVGL